MRIVLIAAAATAATVWAQPAAAQGAKATGQWVKRTPVKPDPSKVVVPPGYKVGVFKAGLDTPASAAVDKDGNLWVTISGVLLGSPEADQFEPPHVKIFDKDGKLLREVGKGTFQDGDERDRLLRRERQDLHSRIRREDLGNGRRECRAEADHQGSVHRRPSQRRHHLQGRLSSILRSAFRATAASPIPTTMAGPTSRTIRSG